jgi:hypothetical protein
MGYLLLCPFLAVHLFCIPWFLTFFIFLENVPCFMLFSVDDGQGIIKEAEEPTPPQKETDCQDGQQQWNSLTFKEIDYIFAPCNLFLC